MTHTWMTRDPEVLDGAALDQVDCWWRAANYLSIGQIYLLANPLLREPLVKEHIKPRLLGHWGTTPGLNFVYAHLNRAIRPQQPGGHRQCGGLARAVRPHQAEKGAAGNHEVEVVDGDGRAEALGEPADLERGMAGHRHAFQPTLGR